MTLGLGWEGGKERGKVSLEGALESESGMRWRRHRVWKFVGRESVVEQVAASLVCFLGRDVN